MLNVSQIKKGLKSLLPNKWSRVVRFSFWIALFVHVSGFLLFQLITNYLPDRQPARPYVTFVSDDSMAKDTELEESALLFDSAPLFIPTRWNASQRIEVDFEDVSLGQFAEFEPQIKLLNELRPTSALIAEPYPINQPSDLLASRFWRFFGDFGQSTDVIQPFESAAPLAEISVQGESERWVIPLRADLESAKPFSMLRPAFYAVRMSNSGLAWSVPTLIETSGDEAFDQSVAQWLQRPEILALLPDGYLSIRVFFW